MSASFERRRHSLRYRIQALPRLRALVGLGPREDIRPAQWALIERALNAASERLLRRLDQVEAFADAATDRDHNAALGEIELDLSKAYTFFDTYMDVLTQRRSAELGPQLAGCDELAEDALRREHPALRAIIRPLVYCDRGFGASFLREGVPMPDGSSNPLPLIQIPYARLREKHSLTSVLHEAGHYAFNRIGLHAPLANAAAAALRAAGFAPAIGELYAGWMREIGPDFWTFGTAGAAHASGLRELLSLPARIVMKLEPRDPHPPPFLRVLLGFAWCRRAWGAGDWDAWEAEWLRTFGEGDATLAACRAAIPGVTAMLFTTRFAALDGRTLPDLFDLESLRPDELLARMRGLNQDSPAFLALRPCTQLCVFRLTHEGARATPESIDRAMTGWLTRLAAVGRTQGE